MLFSRSLCVRVVMMTFAMTMLFGSRTFLAADGLTPYSGSPISLPGTVRAAEYDWGGSGVAYWDSTPGNEGGECRTEDVDLQSSSEGGCNIGWTTAGEWLNYTVNMTSSGTYKVQLRVATPIGGQKMHVGFNGPSSVWQEVTIPSTSGWQNWTTAEFPAYVSAGTQQITVLFDTGAVNLSKITVVPAGSGGEVDPVVVTWNIEVNSDESHSRGAIDRLMDLSPRPQIVVLQEASTDQIPVYVDELQRRSGQTWYSAFQTHCPPGAWTGYTCGTASWYEGVGVFSTYPIVDSSGAWFPYPDCWTSARGAVRAALNVEGILVQVFAVHLQTGFCTDPFEARYNTMRDFKGWAGSYSTPQLVGGDFNADPNQIDTPAGMSPNFVDSWSLVGSGVGATAFTPSPLYKLDYWFADASGKATPQWSSVVTSTGTFSDHFPVIAGFVIQ